MVMPLGFTDVLLLRQSELPCSQRLAMNLGVLENRGQQRAWPSCNQHCLLVARHSTRMSASKPHGEEMPQATTAQNPGIRVVLHITPATYVAGILAAQRRDQKLNEFLDGAIVMACADGDDSPDRLLPWGTHAMERCPADTSRAASSRTAMPAASTARTASTSAGARRASISWVNSASSCVRRRHRRITDV